MTEQSALPDFMKDMDLPLVTFSLTTIGEDGTIMSLGWRPDGGQVQAVREILGLPLSDLLMPAGAVTGAYEQVTRNAAIMINPESGTA